MYSHTGYALYDCIIGTGTHEHTYLSTLAEYGTSASRGLRRVSESRAPPAPPRAGARKSQRRPSSRARGHEPRQRRGSPGAWGMKPVDTLDCDTDAPEFLDDQDERAALLGPARSGSAYAQEPLLAVSATGCTKHGRAVLTSHADALSLFCSARYRVPMLVVWATALGGAMHEPAVPYFYLSLGLSASQIGQAGGILTTGSLLLAPMYGWLFDKRSALLALVLGISLCGGGCLLRALATGPPTVLLSAVVMSVDGSFESLVLAYVARDQPAESEDAGRTSSRITKAAVISAFLAQVQLMRIAGRGLYPAWNWSVRRLIHTEESAPAAGGIEEPGAGVGSSQLLRYRIVLASCVVPCVIGFFALLWLCCTSNAPVGAGQAPGAVYVPMQVVPDARRHAANARDKPAAVVQPSGDMSSQPGSTGRRSHSTCIAVAIVAALISQGAVMALTYTLWPLFLRVRPTSTFSLATHFLIQI